jgi:mxaJ protein
MYSHFLKIVFCASFGSLLISCGNLGSSAIAEKQYIEPLKQAKVPVSQTALRVCADPNNLPFSNSKGEGFENKIAQLIASDMKLPVEYTWWAQRRGFFRNTLGAGKCDLVIGLPNGTERAETTAPYYRSSYVFVSRADRGLCVTSLDDPQLKDLVIGVQMIGDDGLNTPPVHALSNRGIVNNIKGYTVYGNYQLANPPARIISAVVDRDVDIAIVWGPLAGYFAKRQPVPLSVVPVSPQVDPPDLPFAFDISMGVRSGEDEFRNKVEEITARRRDEIEKILAEYNVPRLADDTPIFTAGKTEGE